MLELTEDTMHAICSLVPQRTMLLRCTSKSIRAILKRAKTPVLVISPNEEQAVGFQDIVRGVSTLIGYNHSMHLHIKYCGPASQKWVQGLVLALRDWPPIQLLTCHYNNSMSEMIGTAVDCAGMSDIMQHMDITSLAYFGMVAECRVGSHFAIKHDRGTREGGFKLFWPDETPMWMPKLKDLHSLCILHCAQIDGLASCMGLLEGLPQLQELHLGALDTRIFVESHSDPEQPLPCFERLCALSLSFPRVRRGGPGQYLRLLTSDSLPRLAELTIVDIGEEWSEHMHELLRAVLLLRGLRRLELEKLNDGWVEDVRDWEITKLEDWTEIRKLDFEHLRLASFEKWLPRYLQYRERRLERLGTFPW